MGGGRTGFCAARMHADARMRKIYAGTNEAMKFSIARRL